MRRRARPNPYPWRAVVGDARLRTGRGSFLGPDTWRRTAWWVLDLDCGHTVERTVRYRPDETRPKGDRYSTQRSTADVTDPPTRVRCDQCPATTAEEKTMPRPKTYRPADAPVETGTRVRLVLELDDSDVDESTGSGMTGDADNRLNDALTMAGFTIVAGPDRDES